MNKEELKIRIEINQTKEFDNKIICRPVVYNHDDELFKITTHEFSSEQESKFFGISLKNYAKYLNSYYLTNRNNEYSMFFNYTYDDVIDILNDFVSIDDFLKYHDDFFDSELKQKSLLNEELYAHLSNEHDLILTESELSDIIDIVSKYNF